MIEITQDLELQIQQIAEQLPSMPVEFIKTSKVQGSVLISRGVEQISVNGVIRGVIASDVYDAPYLSVKNVNHVEGLKKACSDGGLIGFYNYIVQIPEYIQKSKELYPSLYDENGDYLPVSSEGEIVKRTQ